MMKMLTRREITQTTLLVSNLPGPVEQIMLGNNPIVHMFPVVAGIPQVCIYYSNLRAISHGKPSNGIL
jgi:hypothetical protein